MIRDLFLTLKALLTLGFKMSMIFQDEFLVLQATINMNWGINFACSGLEEALGQEEEEEEEEEDTEAEEAGDPWMDNSG